MVAWDPVAECVVDPASVEDGWGALRRALRQTPRIVRAACSEDPALRFDRASATQARGFSGGWIGFITYDFAARAEGVRSRHAPPKALPGLSFHLYDTFAWFDPRTFGWTAGAVDWPPGRFPGRAGATERLDAALALLKNAAARQAGGGEREFTHDGQTVPEGPEPPLPHGRGSVLHERRKPSDAAAAAVRAAATSPTLPANSPAPGSTAPVRSSLDRPAYDARVRRILDYIAAGDAYQVNLTRRFESVTHLSADLLYLRLRACNPAPYSAFLPRSGYAILSASPELFLDVHDRRVVTRPIKGTRPRGRDPTEDAALRAELGTSEKDRAELNMIVDLLRNDLGRVCDYGSIRVTSAGDIETHPTVHHRVATVEGRLREDVDVGDLLAATMPGGSVTGVPKIRAMQIIDELEPCPRGVYCGAVGFLGLDGRASFNLAIRTMIHYGDNVHVHAGGGIVAESDAQAEYEETLAKAAGLLSALGGQSDVAHDREHESDGDGSKPGVLSTRQYR
ncbi:MAG: Isochorismate synthase MenF [Phycisphaerae bacterium]|nr:Isochorismate synthase MenF [Phycisphaerae bacterium]